MVQPALARRVGSDDQLGDDALCRLAGGSQCAAADAARGLQHDGHGLLFTRVHGAAGCALQPADRVHGADRKRAGWHVDERKRSVGRLHSLRARSIAAAGRAAIELDDRARDRRAIGADHGSGDASEPDHDNVSRHDVAIELHVAETPADVARDLPQRLHAEPAQRDAVEEVETVHVGRQLDGALIRAPPRIANLDSAIGGPGTVRIEDGAFDSAGERPQIVHDERDFDDLSFAIDAAGGRRDAFHIRPAGDERERAARGPRKRPAAVDGRGRFQQR